MTIAEFKTALSTESELRFQLPDGTMVPSHFHITELGLIQKTFVDCGGTLRTDSYVNFQMYTAEDYEHRLPAGKLLKIIEKSTNVPFSENMPVEMEYQTDTIGRFDVSFNGEVFQLLPKHTDCLAKDSCGIPEQKPRIKLSELNKSQCVPQSGCC